MTPEKQRIAIAEACGWRIAKRVLPESKEEAIACWIQPNGNEWQEQILPNYTKDLNAMHEAEKILIRPNLYAKGGWGMYLSHLSKVTDEQHPIDATATQRAEAFLRAIEKWEGE